MFSENQVDKIKINEDDAPVRRKHNGQLKLRSRKSDLPIIHETPFVLKNKFKEDVEKEEEGSGKENFAKKLKLSLVLALSIGVGVATFSKMVDKEIDSIEQDLDTNLSLVEADNKSAINIEETRRSLERDTKKRDEEVKIENLGDVFVEAYKEIEQLKDFPSTVLSDDFFSAVELQESGGDPWVVSSVGAKGVMQNMHGSLNDNLAHSRELKKDGEIKFKGSEMISEGEKLTKKEIREVDELIGQNGEYGRAFGKMYYYVLWDRYSIGKDKMSKGELAGAQVELLGAYNGGMGNIESKEFDNWPDETRKYCRKIFRNMDNIEKVRRELTKDELEGVSDFAVMNIVKMMNSSKKGKDFMMQKGIGMVKKLKEEKPDFTESDVRMVFAPVIKAGKSKIKKILIAKNV